VPRYFEVKHLSEPGMAETRNLNEAKNQNFKSLLKFSPGLPSNVTAGISANK